jgi:hypothetical protein
VNYKAHSDLSWFRLLLKGNSPTSSSLILKINTDNYELVIFTSMIKLHDQWGPD